MGIEVIGCTIDPKLRGTNPPECLSFKTPEGVRFPDGVHLKVDVVSVDDNGKFSLGRAICSNTGCASHERCQVTNT